MPNRRRPFFSGGRGRPARVPLLEAEFRDVPWVDLLLPATYPRYVQTPELLIEEQRRHGADFIVIDEVQKVPALLDVVHWLIERRGVHFALCGSSARKVRRGQANLLGGRGERRELHGLSAMEIGSGVDLVRLLNHGYLPPIYDAKRPLPLLDAYVSEYLKEEIAAEGLVRRLPAYADFLALAALSDGDVVNYTTIARDAGVSSQTVRGYFEILEDTLLGRFLPAYRRRPKRRVVAAPKFYFGDVGVVNFLAKRGAVRAGGELFGKAFENWVFHELCCYNSYRARYADFFLLAAQLRDRGRLRGQPHRLCRGSQGGQPGARRSHQGATRVASRSSGDCPPDRGVARPSRPYDGRQHRAAPLHHVSEAALARSVLLTRTAMVSTRRQA